LDGHVSLRRSMSDPGATPRAREQLATAVFGPHVSASVLAVVVAAAARRWSTSGALSAALERQGVRSELKAALVEGTLDDVEDELFRFGQTVAGSGELAEILGARQIPIQHRQTIIDELLADKASSHTVVLVRRAVAARSQNFARSLESMMAIAADLRNRALARVTVASPLSHEQFVKLGALLNRMLGRPVDIQVSVDPTVLGGMRVQVGDEVIEGTVQHRLTEAGRQLAG
jgi:F-type H+-transporting ATPase subunit delta